MLFPLSPSLHAITMETYSGGVYTKRYVMGGPTWPDGVAVDASGNIYVCAPFDDYVAKLTPNGNGYTLTYIGSMLVQPHGVAVDAAGNVYIADGRGDRILKETLSGSTYTQSVVESGLNLPEAIAVDSNGTLYFNDPYGGVIYKLSQSGANFGVTSVGTKSSAVSLVFTFDTAGTIGTPAVVTQGIPNLDFADAGTGTCTTNGTSHAYAIGDTCTVDVIFKPKAPGARYGAAVLKNNSGTVIATGYAQGIGSGPQVSFAPGTQSTLSFGGLTNFGPMAVDAVGSIYLVSCPTAYDPTCGIFKETWNGNGYTQTTVVDRAGTSYFPYGYPGAIAVDGMGNVFFTDPEDSEVVEATPSSSGYTISVPFPYKGTVWGVAVDGAGNVFIGSFALGLIKETLSGTSYIQSTVGRTTYAYGIAVDGDGNLYVANTTSSLFKETPLNGGYVQTSIASTQNGYHAVALDGGGNLYATEAFGHNVYKESLSGGNYTESTIATIGENTYEPSALALDGNGNVYISVNGVPNSGTAISAAFKLDLTDPPALSFASTGYGATSSNSPQTVAVANVGNAALSFPVPIGGNNPSTATSFSLNDSSASACPIVGAGSSSAGTLAAGASCELAISFVPAAVGSINGSLVLTDDALNTTAPNYATQSISLSGTGTQATPTISWATPAAVSYGTALGAAQLNATASVPGTFSYSPLTGTVPSVGTQTLSASFIPTDGTDYTTASATTSLVVNKVSPSNTLVSSSASVFVSNPVTFTTTLASSAGTPTGTVSFYDGTTLLGTPTLNGGLATYTTSALAAGTHSITAVYSGDGNFSAVTSATVSEVVEDFTVGPPSGGSTSATASPGGQATFALAMTPPSGQSFAAPITFAVTGLPTGATATFSPASIAAGAGATNVTLTVQLPSTAKVEPATGLFGKGGMTVALGLILLPLLGRRRRAQLGRIGCWGLTWILAGVGGAALFATLAGCGGSSGSSSGTQPQSYTLTVKATSGSLTHTTILSLTVQ